MQYQNKLYVALAISLISLVGCDDEKDVNYTMDVSADITVIATLGIESAQSAESARFNPDASEGFQSNNTTSSLVNSMKFNALQLVVNSPEDKDLSFIDDVEVYILDEFDNEVRIGFVNNVGSSRSVSLSRDNVDVQEYLKQSAVGFRIVYTSDEFAQDNRECTITGRVSVDAIEK
ncbi:MAG: hypothetical protein Salg2KO_22510 [Salibacteraceae bacterium]